MSGKIFDYLESNLTPVLSSYELLLFILKRYHQVIEINENSYFEEIKSKLQNLNSDKPEDRKKNNSSRIEIVSQSKRLIEFYRNC